MAAEPGKVEDAAASSLRPSAHHAALCHRDSPAISTGEAASLSSVGPAGIGDNAPGLCVVGAAGRARIHQPPADLGVLGRVVLPVGARFVQREDG